jgi:hypothetical protein
MRAKIIEQGNGLPEVGDYCSGNCQLYLIESIDSRIQTDDARGNYFFATVEEADYEDCPEEDEHTALVVPYDDDLEAEVAS